MTQDHSNAEPNFGELSEEDQLILKQELEAYENVKQAVRAAALAQQPNFTGLKKGLVDLQEEARTANNRDLPSLMDQIHVSQSLASRETKVKLPDMRAPYFAHIQLLENGARKDVLIGHDTFIDAERKVTIIDWRHAPVAKIFFNYKEGEEYEVELPTRIAAGVLVSRRIIHFEVGQLIGVANADLAFIREDGKWIKDSGSPSADLHGGEGQATRGLQLGTGRGGRKQVAVAALLDDEQYRLLDAPDDEPLLVLGGAGSGKTTVALHRIANLFYRDPEKYSQHKAIVIVPEEGLVRLSRKLLDSLQMKRVKLSTFDNWIYDQCKHVLRTLPKKLCQDTPSKVVRYKRHGAVVNAFPLLEKMRTQRFAKQLERELPIYKTIASDFLNHKARNLLEKIRSFEQVAISYIKSNAKATACEQLLKNCSQTFKHIYEDLYDLNFDRIELFSNKTIVQAVIDSSDGELKNDVAKELESHSRDQFPMTSQINMQDVDSDFGGALDHQSLDADTPDDVANTIDLEDYAILLALLRFYTGEMRTKWGRVHSYTHMVIDEAQELSSLELGVLGQTLEADASVTVAGDAVQQTDPTSVFETWEKVLEYLGQNQVTANHLTTSYRCSQFIMDFAYEVLGDQAPKQRPVATKQGAPVIRTRASSDGHASLIMREALEALHLKEPMASVAIICSDMEIASQVYQGLEELPNIRLVEGGAFSFKAGIDVTDVSQVKGLEFDYVIIPDADIYCYPDTPKARRSLHVAITRTIHQLWVLSSNKPSFILPKVEDRGQNP